MAKQKRAYYQGRRGRGSVFTLVANTSAAYTNRERFIVFVGSVCCGMLLLWISGAAGFPATPAFNGSILLSGSPLLTLIAVVIALGCCTIIGAIEAALLQDEAALFCTCLGLAALSIRGGAIRPVLQYSAGSGAFAALAVEVAVLSALVLSSWIVLRIWLVNVGTKDRLDADILAPNELANPTLQDRLSTTGSQMLAMAVIEFILIQSESKPQALAGVFIAGYVGSLTAYWFTNVPEAIWYLIGPALVGCVGYILAMLSPQGLAIGEAHGWAAALARPVPLDYASLGIAGSLLGYWTSRRWAQPEEDLEDEAPDPQPAPSA